MKNKIKNPAVLISGAGQLGSRYLQGLSKCRIPLRIYVQDVSQKSLEQAEQRWKEVNGFETQHVVSFHSKIEQCPQHLDIAIIATTAHCRPQIVKDIADHSKVGHWILEKVLAQSSRGLDEIALQVTGSLAWVNTMRRAILWHQSIKAQLKPLAPLHMNVTGGAWGLACNAVHFLDLLAWWSGESILEITTDQLENFWFEAKREGNWEVFGTLEARYSGGSTVKMVAGEGEPVYVIHLQDGSWSWRIDEGKGLANRSDGFEISGRLPFQSEMTSSLIDQLLEVGRCQLPSLETSVEIHRIFLDAMLAHWRCNVDSSATFVPIT
jgi:predicted dehydrogenase